MRKTASSILSSIVLSKHPYSSSEFGEGSTSNFAASASPSSKALVLVAGGSVADLTASIGIPSSISRQGTLSFSAKSCDKSPNSVASGFFTNPSKTQRVGGTIKIFPVRKVSSKSFAELQKLSANSPESTLKLIRSRKSTR